MKNKSLIQILSVVALFSAPFIYAAFIWQDLPDRVAVHFGIDGKPDAFGSKTQALMPVAFLMLLGLGMYFLLKNIEKIDPKRAKQASKGTFDKIALLILLLMSALSTDIIYSALHNQTGRFLFILLGLFFAGMGNLMHSLQPNYFVGLRLPWTLSDDANWRKTHQLAGKIWFGGGLVIAFSALFLTEQQSLFFMLGAIVLMCLIPIVYSYRYFKKMA